mmetsp:Transcript_9984/g.21587  ORF Transcript_9984/g.21587 Transcript_9984/m.21587 type:complete len:85 (+) Transcript_9984:314-568(+)
MRTRGLQHDFHRLAIIIPMQLEAKDNFSPRIQSMVTGYRVIVVGAVIHSCFSFTVESNVEANIFGGAPIPQLDTSSCPKLSTAR